MSEEWTLLVEAVQSLKTSPHYLKDYIWPAVIGLTSSFLGAGIAFMTIKHQERIQFEKDKLESGNLIIIKAVQSQAHLVAWKVNYVHAMAEGVQFNNNPIHRMLSVPRMAGENKSLDFKIESIVFILKKVSEESALSKWRNITRIMSMLETIMSFK